MKFLATLLALALFAVAAPTVPRPAPDFSFAGIGGKKSLRSLRGQPVVVLVAKSPKTRAFRKQLDRIESIYNEFASRGTVFVCAFAEEGGTVKTDIPVVLASNGPAVTEAYGMVDGFGIGIIGRDGNLDLLTGDVLGAFRIREVIQNSYDVQNDVRKQQPKGPPE